MIILLSDFLDQFWCLGSQGRGLGYQGRGLGSRGGLAPGFDIKTFGFWRIIQFQAKNVYRV